MKLQRRCFSHNIFLDMTQVAFYAYFRHSFLAFSFLTTCVESFASRSNELFHNGSHKPEWLQLHASSMQLVKSTGTLCYEYSITSMFSLFSAVIHLFSNIQNSFSTKLKCQQHFLSLFLRFTYLCTDQFYSANS